jgi:RNA polymerase sigma factor (sigma-70 family)
VAEVINGIRISEHTGLVYSIAKRFAWACTGALELEDLVNAGLEGTMVAARKFDHSRGLKFSTYASWWVRHHIAREAQDRGRTIRIPVHVQEKTRKKNKLRMKADPLAELDWLPCPTTSLDEPIRDDGSNLLSLLSSHAATAEESMQSDQRAAASRDLLDTLDARTRLVMRLFFFEGQNLAQIGDRLGLSRERIRQIKLKALGQLRARAVLTGVADLQGGCG